MTLRRIVVSSGVVPEFLTESVCESFHDRYGWPLAPSCYLFENTTLLTIIATQKTTVKLADACRSQGLASTGSSAARVTAKFCFVTSPDRR